MIARTVTGARGWTAIT